MPSRHQRSWAYLRLSSLAALVVFALGSAANASEAVVGRASSAVIRARVVELVNEARSRGRRCGAEHFARGTSQNLEQAQ